MTQGLTLRDFLWLKADLDGIVHETPRLQVVSLVRDPPGVELSISSDILLCNISGDVCADREFAGWGLQQEGRVSLRKSQNDDFDLFALQSTWATT